MLSAAPSSASRDLRLRSGTGGFTLIELLVVILLIAVLASVAIPVFLQQRKRAYESSARQQLSSIAKTQESYYAGSDRYSTDLTTGSSTGLWGQGWRADPGVAVSVALSNATHPGGYCIQSYSLAVPQTVYHFTNAGPGAGVIQEAPPGPSPLAACS